MWIGWIGCGAPEVPGVPLPGGDPGQSPSTTGSTGPSSTSSSIPTRSGTASFRRAVDGVTLCDQAVDLVLTPYAGDCPDCAWAYAVAATSTRDESSDPGCGPWSTGFADQPADPWFEYQVNPRVAFTDAFVVGPTTWPSAVLRGADIRDDYGDEGYDGAWWVWASASDAVAEPTLHPSTYAFDASSVEVYTADDRPYLDLSTGDTACWTDVQGTNAAPLAGVSGQGALRCDGTIDRWAFDAVAGDAITVSVDVPDASRGFDPMTGVALDGCWVHLADDVFDCAASILPDGCPGSTFVAPETGTYTVEVRGVDGTCAGPTGDYRVTVAGSPAVSLVDDDVTAPIPLAKIRIETSLSLSLPAP
ncbi:MAG: hypothetical protein ABMB14_19245 [Myxococcota bacterium]